MPRPLREEVEGGVFHVYARGNDRQAIYLDDRDRRVYLAMLGVVVARTRWRCLSFCLMPNHVHLLLETPQPNLAAGMQRLHSNYAQAFNRRHGRCGHLFQGRYGALRLRTDEHLCSVVGYIAVNPVSSSLCERPELWRWSSHSAALGGRRPPWLDIDRMLKYLDGLGGDARSTYRRLVEQRLAKAAATAALSR